MSRERVIDDMARRMAEALNGGMWTTHYVESQRAVWRRRAAAILDGGF